MLSRIKVSYQFTDAAKRWDVYLVVVCRREGRIRMEQWSRLRGEEGGRQAILETRERRLIKDRPACMHMYVNVRGFPCFLTEQML